MKTTTLRMLTLLTCLAASGSALALQINFGAPTPGTILSGAVGAVDVSLSGVPANLASISFNVGYDAPGLAFEDFPPTPFTLPVEGIADGALAGLVSVGAFVPAPSVLPGDLLLTTLSFRGLGVGPRDLTFLIGPELSPTAQVYDVAGQLTDFVGPIDVGPAARVNVIPEPGTAVLLGSGLAGLLACGARRKQR